MNAVILKDMSMEIEMNEMSIFNEEDIRNIKRGGTMWWEENSHNVLSRAKTVAIIAMTAVSLGVFAINAINDMNAAGNISNNMEYAITSEVENTYGHNNG